MSNDALDRITQLHAGTMTPDWYNVDTALQAVARRVLELEARVRALEEANAKNA